MTLEELKSLGKEELNRMLIYSVERGLINQVILYLKAGADVTAYDNYPILEAVENGDTDLVDLLIQYGADVTANDNYAIRWASENGYPEVVKLLIKYGADVSREVLNSIIRLGDDELTRIARKKSRISSVKL